jgi:hypothetical protein
MSDQGKNVTTFNARDKILSLLQKLQIWTSFVDTFYAM